MRKVGYWAQKGTRGRRAAALVDTELVLHSKYKSRHLGQQYPEDSHPRESYLIKKTKNDIAESGSEKQREKERERDGSIK